MILSDGHITDLIEEGELTIDGFKRENLTPNGYDLTIEEVSVEGRRAETEGRALIPSNTWFVVSTEEYVEFPGGITGELWIRTTWARKGIIPSFGMIDAGFEGDLTLSAFNTCREVEIPIGETFAQIVFHLLSQESDKQYEERSGNYQGQRGVNL